MVLTNAEESWPWTPLVQSGADVLGGAGLPINWAEGEVDTTHTLFGVLGCTSDTGDG